ncbi:related to steroid monooxygenase [Phialocephala subalpina]|uniref:Related to steroid monooxygenase n=1 Tax=Phialocephala subalpina TaxID=576137 RepID=A0A1L7XPT3_9HELO|nr:related to steroid monooxygenase [Phialocephala subalpina]
MPSRPDEGVFIPDAKGYVVDEHIFGEPRQLRIITLGAGASGLNVARQIEKHMEAVDLQIYEKNSDVGGTWLENRYPGCACDIPSHSYQYTWAPNPNWKKFYSPGPEILEYFQDIAEKYDLRRYIKFRHQIISAIWDEEAGIWNIRVKNLETGEEIEDWCHFFINASGFLNNWKWPEIKGLDTFKGDIKHSAAWNPETDLSNKTVAVIGSGSSAIQIVPSIQPEVKHLTTFVRSPTWVTAGFAQSKAGPGGTNFEFSIEQKDEFAKDPEKYLAYRKDVEKEMCSRFRMLHKDTPEQKAAVEFSTSDMKSKLGPNNPLADFIIPKFAVGCRRPTPGNGYLESLTKENVRVITDEIAEVVPEGLVLNTGETLKVDVLICATGFDLSFCPRFPVIGRNGANLAEQWKERATAYLSMAPENMPNYFMFTGPNSPVSHGSAIPIIEHTTKYILKMLYKCQTESIKAICPSPSAIREYKTHADVFLTRTAWSTKCRSWFKNGKIDGPVVALYPGSRIHWFHMMTNPRYEDWEWTRLNPLNRFAYLGNGFSVREGAGRDLTWYFDDPDVGYEGLLY